MSLYVTTGKLCSTGGKMVSDNTPPPAFDYYIHPNGNDVNPGTIGSPWALTALNTKRATYAGKRVGLLDGTYSCLTILGISQYTGGFSTPAFNIAGGTASAQTVIQAVNPRMAILDGQSTSTATNVNGQPIIGSEGNGNGGGVAGLGYITLDGVKIINNCGRIIYFLGIAGAPFTGTVRLKGMIVQNCDLSQMFNTAAGGNPTYITLQACDGALVQNNKMYSATDPTNRSSGIEIWTSINCITQYNTVIASANLKSGILHKNSSQRNNIIRFNYIDMSAAGTGSFSVTCDADGGAGTWIQINNNVGIGDGPVAPDAIDVGGFPNTLHTKYIFNNTWVASPNSSVGMCTFFGAAATMNYYNNITKRGTIGGRGDYDTNASAPTLQDYNFYPTTAQIGLSTDGTNAYPGTLYTLATIAAHLPAGCVGKEAHSAGGNPLFTGTIDGTGLPSTAYQLQVGSPCKNAGKSDGTTGGSTCDMGAFGNMGSFTRVGCDF